MNWTLPPAELDRFRVDHAAERDRLNHHEAALLHVKLAHDAHLTDIKRRNDKQDKKSTKRTASKAIR